MWLQIKSFCWLRQAGAFGPSVWPPEESVPVEAWDRNEVATAAEMTSGQPRAVWLHCCPSHQTPVLCSSRGMAWHRVWGHSAHPSVWPSFQTALSSCLNCAPLTAGPILSYQSQAHRMGSVVALLCGLLIRWSQVLYILLPLKCNSLQWILACRQGLPH